MLTYLQDGFQLHNVAVCVVCMYICSRLIILSCSILQL